VLLKVLDGIINECVLKIKKNVDKNIKTLKNVEGIKT